MEGGREGMERLEIENEARHERGKVLVRRMGGMEMKGRGRGGNNNRNENATHDEVSKRRGKQTTR